MEVFLPPIKQGETIKINKIVLEDKFTLPRPRYNPSTLLKQMEKSEIGTKATRADIIQTLYSRKYIQSENITATDLGLAIIQILEQYCPAIISTKLTRQIEEKMNKIQEGSEKKENVLKETIKILKPILEEIKRNENDIGKNVNEALKKSLQEERTVGTCLTCKTGKLVILQSRKTGKRFIGCTNYFKNQCETTFPLPQKGTIKPLHQTCNKCGWPTVLVRIYRKRPWTLCVNSACPQKQQKKKRG
jgi:DNA topoisomerase-1